MIEAVLVYLTAWATWALVGVAVLALARPRGRWFHYWTPVVGACGLVVVAYPLSHLGPMRIVGPAILIGAVAVIMLMALLRWRIAAWPGLRTVAAPTRRGAMVIGLGALGGLILMWPVLAQGMATTVAITNNDAWYYAGVVNWIDQNAINATMVPGLTNPLDGSVTMLRNAHLPYGLELILATVHSILPVAPHQVPGPAAAAMIPLAVAGWVALADAVMPRAPRGPLALIAIAAAAASPLLALAYYETYLTQFVTLALMPGAIATAVWLARRPSLSSLGLYAITAAGVVGIYFGMLPWLALMSLVAFVAITPAWPAKAPDLLRRGGVVGRATSAVALVVASLGAAVVLAPVTAARAWEFIRMAAAFSEPGPAHPFGPRAGGTFLLGATNSPITPLEWRQNLGVAVVIGVGLVAGILLLRRRDAAWLAAGLGVAALAATGIIFLRYHQSGFLYGTYKTLITGGALMAGSMLVVLVGVARGGRARVVTALGIVAVVAVWGSTSLSLSRSADQAVPGFRTDDVAMGEALDRLPDGSNILADGTDRDWAFPAFQMRHMAAYFITRNPGLLGIGLWSTPTYISPGPLPDFRPAQLWSHVLTSRPGPFDVGRTHIWSQGIYSLYEAPLIDVTQYGDSWYRPEEDEGGLFQWTGGPNELVVINRTGQDRVARVRMRIESFGQDRTFSASIEGRELMRAPIRSGSDRAVVIPVPLRSAEVVTVQITASGEAQSPGPDPRHLLFRVREVEVAGSRVTAPARHTPEA